MNESEAVMMTNGTIRSWDIPLEVLQGLPASLEETVDGCYADLDILIRYNNRCWAAMFYTSAAFMVAFCVVLLKWKEYFPQFNMFEASAAIAALGGIGAWLGWRLGEIKNRTNIRAIENRILRGIQHTGPLLAGLKHIRDREPRREYRKLVEHLFALASEPYSR